MGTALNSVFSRIDRLVIEELAEAEKVSKQLSEKLTVEITNLLKKYNPVMTKIKAALKWLEHEARETAVFVYKYYNLQHKYDQIKDFIMKKAAEISKEVKVTVEKVKQIVLKVPQILKKFMDKYGEELMKLVKKIQIKVNELVAKIKKMIPQISETLKKYIASVDKCIKKCTKFIEVYGMHAAGVVADKTFRGIHSGLRKAAKLEKDIELV